MCLCEREIWGVGEHYMGVGEGDPRPGSGLGVMSEVRGQGSGLEREEDEWIGEMGQGAPSEFLFSPTMTSCLRKGQRLGLP